MEPEVVEGWEIERKDSAGLVGFIARKIANPDRCLEVWTHRGTLDFDDQDCWNEEFPLAVILRLLELRAAAIKGAAFRAGGRTGCERAADEERRVFGRTEEA